MTFTLESNVATRELGTVRLRGRIEAVHDTAPDDGMLIGEHRIAVDHVDDGFVTADPEVDGDP